MRLTWLRFRREFASDWLSFQNESTIESDIATAKAKHNAFLVELGLKPLP
jgi:hypothetical protein